MWVHDEFTVGFKYPEDFERERKFLEKNSGWTKKSESTIGTTYTWIKEYTLMEGVKDGEYLNKKTGQSKVSTLGDV